MMRACAKAQIEKIRDKAWIDEATVALPTFAGHILYPTHDLCVAAARGALWRFAKEGPDFITTELAPCTKPGRELPGGWLWESFADAKERVRRAG
jgi:hypothetical protein